MRIEDQNIYILHTYPFKETSLLVEVFSENFGRLSLLAKGARRPRSLLRGYLQPFQLVQGTWSGQGELKTLFGVEWVSKYLGLNNQGLVCGFYLNELMMKLLPKADPNQSLFNYYHKCLVALSVSKNHEKILRSFELKLLQVLGYQVNLLTDENGEPISDDKNYIFEAEYGASSPDKTQNGVKVKGKTLQDMSNENYKDHVTVNESKLLMRYLISFYTENHNLKSKELFYKS
jgi:DNA repair protein RecO (recombination protein O)